MTANFDDTPSITTTRADASPTAARWGGRILTSIAVLFLTVDALAKIARAKVATEGTVQLGFPADSVVPIGLILLVCVICYVIPRIAPLGAILLTGYLGGAIAANVRLEKPLFTYELFPIYVAAFIWGGLYLRDARVRALVRPAR